MRYWILGILLFFLFKVQAQTSRGTDFWVATTYPFYSNDTFYIAIASEKPTKAYVEIPGFNWKDSVTLGYNEIKNVFIPKNIRNSYYYYYSTAAQKLGKNAIHVTSVLPTRVYAFSEGRWYSSGATSVFPSNSQPPGGSYYPFKGRYYYSWSGGFWFYHLYFFDIIAIDDSVTVTFNATTGMNNLPPGNTLFLKKGQNARIYSWIFNAQGNLEVKASAGKRIAVYTENFYDYAGDNCWMYDLMYEQVLPNTIVGEKYILTPYAYHKKGYEYAVVANLDSTIVYQDNVKKATLNKSEIYYGRVYGDSAVEVKSSKPSNCWEKNRLDTCLGWWSGYYTGPSLMTLSTSEQFINSCVVTVPKGVAFTQHFTNIIVPPFGKDSVWLDGNRLPGGKFKSILGGKFFLYVDSIEKGNHKIECNQGFISYIYGRGQWGSYAYNASSSLQNLKRIIYFTNYKSCDTGYVIKLTSSGIAAKSFKWIVNDQWKDTGLTAYFQIPKAGFYPVKLLYQKMDNTWDSSYQLINIISNNPMDFIVEKEVRACQNSFTINLPNSKLFSYKWFDNSSISKRTFNTNGSYSVTVTNNTTGCKWHDTFKLFLFNKINPGMSIAMAKQCPNIPIYLTNTTSTSISDSIVKYQWYVDGIKAGTKRHDTVPKAAPGNYAFTVIMTTKNGCVDSATGKIFVSAKPILITGRKIYDSCYRRDSFRFDSRSAILDGRIVGLRWLLGNGDTTRTGQQEFYGFKDSGKYSFRLVGYTEKGCTDTTVAKFVKVYSAPSPKYSMADSSVCLSGNYFKPKNESTPTTNVFYEWHWGDGTGTTALTPFPKTYTDTGKYLLKLVQGYVSTGCTDTFKRYVRVLSSPKASMFIDSYNFCLNKNYYRVKNTSTAVKSGFETITWKWGDNTSTKDTFNYKKVYKTAGTFKIKMYYSTGKGCLDSAQKNVVVYASPVAKFDFTDSNICGANNFYDIKNNSTNIGPNAKWNWNYGDATNSSLRNNTYKKTYTNFGNYTITLAINDPLYSCKDTFKRSIKILKGISLNPKWKDTFACLKSDTFTFYDSSNYGNIIPKRTWVFKNTTPLTDTAAKVSRLFNKSGFHQVTLKSGIPKVCFDSTKITVHINYDSNILKTNHTIKYACENGIVDLNSNTSVTSGVGYTYDWKLGEAGNSVLPNPKNNIYKTAGKKIISLTITDQRNCSFSQKDSFTILPAPISTIVNLNADTQCLVNNKFNFNFNTVNSKGVKTAAWLSSEGNTFNAKSIANLQFLTAGKKQLQLIFSDSNDCIDTAYFNMYINESPTINFTTKDICEKEFYTIIPTVTPATVAVKEIKWFINNAYTSSGNNYVFNGNTIGNYLINCYVNAVGNCGDSGTTQNINVHPKPTVDFIANAQTATAVGVPVVFTNNSVGATNYKWYPFNKNIYTSKDLNFTYPILGKMFPKLVAESSFGCKDSITKSIDIISEELIFIPNTFSPDNNGINDEFKAGGISAVKYFNMEIYDRWGNKLYQSNDATKGWDGTFANKPCISGVYVYKIELEFFTGKKYSTNGTITLVK